MIPSVVVDIIQLSFFSIFGIYIIIRLSLLFQRYSISYKYQKLFPRIVLIALIISFFEDTRKSSTIVIFLWIFDFAFYFSAYFLLIFWLGQIRNEISTLSNSQLKSRNRKLKWVFLLVVVMVIISLSLIVSYTGVNRRWDRLFETIVFILASIGILIYSFHLFKMTSIPKLQVLALHKSLKRLLIGVILCLICFVVRIPLLALYSLDKNTSSNEAYFLCYIIIGEVMASFCFVSIFELPAKKSQKQVIQMERITERLMNSENID
ncbi:tobamovirus multiplication protein 1-like isoform x1 [Anaeramoeba ignava]|uniref:Tobamovirus multiplication protein 1-like isoform x1 n=1 Tax=Anaeramoeba ignava TaxID=1746090 RepID=A0A9Q0LCW6_ANAIG|nr:tobamovirus multiplication protein 1-like isoform x1 [Anaeramoeba ignava]